MPPISPILIALLASMTAIGAIAGWILRGKRAEQEKAAVSAGWQEQIDAQRREGGRLLEQNKSLMEQVAQFQAQHTDAKNRARELSLVVQEAFERRDELQREIKDVRSNLETVLSERDQLAFDMESRATDADLLQQKDRRIEKLTRELENWQNRLPPLIERFRVRNEEAGHAEAELEAAQARIRELEAAQAAQASQMAAADGETRIEPVSHPEELTDGLDASNDPEDDAGDDAGDVIDDDTDWATEINEAVADQDDGDFDEVFAADEADDADDADDADELPPEDSAILAEAVAAELVAEPHNHRDDLQMIKGVGPAIENTLNEMGIFRLQQIAEMSEYDIDRVARRLKGFHSRIEREDWIGQARLLIDQAANA